MHQHSGIISFLCTFHLIVSLFLFLTCFLVELFLFCFHVKLTDYLYVCSTVCCMSSLNVECYNTLWQVYTHSVRLWEIDVCLREILGFYTKREFLIAFAKTLLLLLLQLLLLLFCFYYHYYLCWTRDFLFFSFNNANFRILSRKVEWCIYKDCERVLEEWLCVCVCVC